MMSGKPVQRQFNKWDFPRSRCWSTAAGFCRLEKVWNEANRKAFDWWIHTLSQHCDHQWFVCLCGPFLLPSEAEFYWTHRTVPLQRNKPLSLVYSQPTTVSLAHVQSVDFDLPHCVTVSHSSRYLTYNSTASTRQGFLCNSSRVWIKVAGVSEQACKLQDVY